MGLNFPVNGTDSYSDDNHVSIAGRFLEAAHRFNQVYTPLLCLFGALGNSVSVTVFCKTSRHRNLSSSFYLSALAISDTGFLLSLFAVWLDDMGLSVITTPLSCPLVMYLGQVTCFLSVWFIVAFTMERFFAVCYPLTRPTVCTVARAKKIIFGLSIFALMAFSYVWVIATVLDYPVERFLTTVANTNNNVFESGSSGTNGSSQSSTFPTGNEDNGGGGVGGLNGTMPSAITLEFVTVCSVRQQHVYFSSIASHIDSIFTLILPFAIISYLNIRIALCVWRLRDQRDHLVAVAKITRQNSSHGASSAAATRTQVGFVYRSSIRNNNVNNGNGNSGGGGNGRQNLSPNAAAAGSMNHLNLAHPANYRSKTNLTVDFDMSESSSTSGVVSTHCCTESPPRQHLRRAKRKTGKKKKNSKGGHKRVNNGTTSSHSRAETRVTKTLLLVSTVFLVLNLPSHAIRAATFIQSFWSLNIHQESLFAAQQWANILFNMNFSVNFLLYCVSGRNFRLSVKKIFCRMSSTEARYPKSKCRVASPITGNHSPVDTSLAHRGSLYPPSITEMEYG